VSGCGDDDDSSDDGSGALSFEGSAPDGVTWELEGVEGPDGPCVRFRLTGGSSELSEQCASLDPTCGAIGVAAAEGPDPTIATGPTAAEVQSVTITDTEGITAPSEQASFVQVSDEDAAAIGAEKGFGWYVASIPGKPRRVSLLGHGPGDQLLDSPILLNGGAEPSCQRAAG
jgi:hypothetical protein